MQFGDIPIEEAEGAIIAHSHRLDSKAIKKGTCLSGDHIKLLKEAGYTSIIGAKLEADDIAEDAAADRLAKAVVGDNISLSTAFTGRVNFYAEHTGVVVYSQERLNAFNLVDEAITLALVPPFQAVEAGQTIGTLKIISFALPDDTVTLTESLGSNAGSLVDVAPYTETQVGFIQSRLAGTKGTVLDSTSDVTAARLAALSSTICHEVRCDHTERAISRAIDETLRKGARMVLISGASAVVDRRDVVPAAIEAAGGVVEHFGMPVDPGNLMLTGHIGDIPVIGMPGCARSPRLNGFDWVLQRLIAGQQISSTEIMGMGAGGLLKDIPSRPLPRSRARRDLHELEAETELGGVSVARAPKIAGLVLAGGQSRRMGTINKLTAEIGGRPMVRHVVDNILSSYANPVTVVVGHEADQVRQALSDCPVSFAENLDYEDGLSTTLKAGLTALPEDIDGVVIALGDMPKVSAEIIDKLIAAFDPLEGRAIIMPTRRGKRGNPILFSKRFFEEMGEVSGDVGARHIVGKHEEVVAEIEVDDPSVLMDVDTPTALAALTGEDDGA